MNKVICTTGIVLTYTSQSQELNIQQSSSPKFIQLPYLSITVDNPTPSDTQANFRPPLTQILGGIKSPGLLGYLVISSV